MFSKAKIKFQTQRAWPVTRLSSSRMSFTLATMSLSSSRCQVQNTRKCCWQLSIWTLATTVCALTTMAISVWSTSATKPLKSIKTTFRWRWNRRITMASPNLTRERTLSCTGDPCSKLRARPNATIAVMRPISSVIGAGWKKEKTDIFLENFKTAQKRKHQVCDGEWQCPNGQDERACPTCQSQSTFVQCPGDLVFDAQLKCLPVNFVCDGVPGKIRRFHYEPPDVALTVILKVISWAFEESSVVKSCT